MHHLFDVSGARVNEPDLLVLASGEERGSVPVPAGRVNDVGVRVDFHHHLADAHIPDEHQVVTAGGEQHVLCRRMPQHQTHPPLMVDQVHDRLGQRPLHKLLLNIVQS
jgi:hypothetical protein